MHNHKAQKSATWPAIRYPTAFPRKNGGGREMGGTGGKWGERGGNGERRGKWGEMGKTYW